MAGRWMNLLIGVTLIQGILTLTHLPVDLEREWEEFSARLDDPDFRLPTTTLPRHYEVTLTPYFDQPPTGVNPFSFTGEAYIYVTATQEGASEIVLHCNDMTIDFLSVTFISNTGSTVNVHQGQQEWVCDPVTHFLRIGVEPLSLSQEYTITTRFTGNLQDNMRGFYKSWYRDSSNNIRWMGTTQFQPGHARSAFPCYDEPGFKATFDISIAREESFSPTISNMPIDSTSSVVNGRITETFHTTPKTSTYLLAFIVSHYQVVSTNNNAQRPFDIYARDNIGNQGEWSLDVGERLLAVMEEYTDYPYYSMAANMNMKQAAIPDFSAGAMENWGLLTYREALILFDPENSNHFYKQRVANIVSHEIAHMWFGNLVTCAWWENLWLNEGFARFYQYYLTDMVEPTLGYPTRFIVEQVHVAMVSDSTDAAHALTNPAVSDPVSVSAHFSTITYARGAAVLRMTQHLLSDATFRKALQNYLKAREYDVAEPHHLFNAFDAAASEDGALTAYPGITITEYFKTWSEKPGHPLLTVSVDQTTGRMTVTQSRWERSSGYSSQPSLFYVPITWTREGAVDFEDLKPARVMTLQVEVLERGTSGNEWVVFNKQESGFYRVNYDPTNWNLLTRALRTNRNVIHEFNRAQIVDDLFAFARANVLPYNRVLNILSFLEVEDAYAPWIAAISGFNFAIRRLAHDDAQRADLNELIIELSAGVVNRLGFAEPDGEDYMTSLLRMYVLSFLCDVGHEGCVNAARANFDSWKNGGFIQPNLRPSVYCSGLRTGDASDFDYFWNRYLNEDLASEQLVLIQAAGCTTDTASLGRFWEAITNGDEVILVRAQELSAALSSAITSNEENTLKSFEWVKANLERVRNTIGLSTTMNTICSRLLNEQQITEVMTWLNENRELIGESVYSSSVSNIEVARSNRAWYEQRNTEFSAYFDTGYVEAEVVEIGVEEEPQPPVTDAPESGPDPAPEPETDEDNGANAAVLSIVTIIASISAVFFA